MCRFFAVGFPCQVLSGERNYGLAWNWNRAFELATGVYLVWICHDDRMEPDYIRQCVEVLAADKRPFCVLPIIIILTLREQ